MASTESSIVAEMGSKPTVKRQRKPLTEQQKAARRERARRSRERKAANKVEATVEQRPCPVAFVALDAFEPAEPPLPVCYPVEPIAEGPTSYVSPAVLSGKLSPVGYGLVAGEWVGVTRPVSRWSRLAGAGVIAGWALAFLAAAGFVVAAAIAAAMQ